MRYLLLTVLLVLSSNFSFAKDYVLNFESSCYQSYGEDIRQRIIDRSITQLNELPNNPRRFIRGPDIEEEIDEHNFSEYLWSPFSSPHSTPFHPVEPRELNPIVCDSDGAIQENQNWFSFGYPVNGWANVPKENQYNFFAVYINESHSLKEICPHEWDDYVNEDLIIYDSTWGENQAVALLTHELGHVIGLAHTTKEEPTNDFPIMYDNNFSLSGVFQTEDYEEFKRAIPWDYNGKDSGYSFESKKEWIENRLKVTVRVNTPDDSRWADAEFLVIAQIAGDDRWWRYSENGWSLREGDLTGVGTTLNYATDLVIFDSDWINEEVTIYFGVRVDGVIYYNKGMPLVIESGSRREIRTLNPEGNSF